MACPICKSDQFYVKDPDDEYEIYEFEWRDGTIEFTDDDAEIEADDIDGRREIFCQRCAWHGKRDAI
jgi:hypothetical protein